MDTVAARLSHCVQMRHCRLGITVHMHTAHKIVLRRNNRYRLLEQIIALLETPTVDIGKMCSHNSFRNMFKRRNSCATPSFSISFKIASVTTSRGSSSSTNRSPLWFKITAPLPRRLRDQKASARLRAVETGRMNLHIIHVLERHMMLLCNAAGVSREQRKIGGMAVKPPMPPVAITVSGA